MISYPLKFVCIERRHSRLKPPLYRQNPPTRVEDLAVKIRYPLLSAWHGHRLCRRGFNRRLHLYVIAKLLGRSRPNAKSATTKSECWVLADGSRTIGALNLANCYLDAIACNPNRKSRNCYRFIVQTLASSQAKILLVNRRSNF